MYTFLPNKYFGQLSDISLKNPKFLKTVNSKFFEVWFTDQNSKTLEIEDNIIITLVNNSSEHTKNEALFNWT